MNLSDEQLQQIREMSAALMPPTEIAILLGLPPDQHDYFCDICKITGRPQYLMSTIKAVCKPNTNSVKPSSNLPKPAARQPNRLPTGT